jgi:hypothetical protein
VDDIYAPLHCVTWTISMRHFTALRGRYWDRLVDMFDLHIHMDEIPTWFIYYTIG